MRSINRDRRFLLAGLGAAVAGSLLSAKLQAGDLKPPPGPVAPTGKGLQQIYDRIARTDQGIAEPRTPVESLPGSDNAVHLITPSGSYCLTQNLKGEARKHGIVIQAENVDLDICGFHLGGPLGSLAAVMTAQQNVCVFDGSFIGWDTGADFQLASRFVLWDLVSLNAARAGFLLGDRGQADDCDAYNTTVGLSTTRERTLVEECCAWTCKLGFSSTGPQNLVLSNCATECGVAFEMGQGSAYGPIVNVAGAGDLSLSPNTFHPGANYVF
jgi:hypothetical protein